MATKPRPDPALFYPGAIYVPANPSNMGGMLEVDRVRLFVVHIAQSNTQSGISNWFRDPVAQVSSHFSVGPYGAVRQYLPLNRVSWAQMDYNDVAWSIEHVGYSGQRLKPLQLRATLKLLDYLHHLAPHVPLHRVSNPEGSGVIGHGELGYAGGDHPDCPGVPILYQLNVALRPVIEPPRWWHYRVG